MFPTSITVCKTTPTFYQVLCNLILLISAQLRYSLNIHQFDCSVLHFLIKNSSTKRTKFTSWFIFLFDISKKNKINKKFWRRPRYVIPGRFGALTGRPGDLMKNLETPGKTGRVGRYVYRYMLLQSVWFRFRFTCNSLSFCAELCCWPQYFLKNSNSRIRHRKVFWEFSLVKGSKVQVD